MEQFRFKIQETFQLRGIGLIVAAEIKVKDATLNVGDEIELRLADGSRFTTKVDSIPMLNPYDPERQFSFSLPKSINKSDVPIGTEVWSHT